MFYFCFFGLKFFDLNCTVNMPKAYKRKVFTEEQFKSIANIWNKITKKKHLIVHRFNPAHLEAIDKIRKYLNLSSYDKV